MKKSNSLNTFVLISKDDIVSPQLVTIREYGRWLQEVYDEYVCNYELYLRAKGSGDTVLQYHPGTKIGQYFDKNTFHDGKYESWFILKESSVINKLKKAGLAELKDTVPSSVTDEKHRQMLRVYTTDQIELYVRTNIDKSFNIRDYIENYPYQIKLGKEGMQYIIKPTIEKKKSTLFNIHQKPVQMTLEGIEKELGRKITIVAKEE